MRKERSYVETELNLSPDNLQAFQAWKTSIYTHEETPAPTPTIKNILWNIHQQSLINVLIHEMAMDYLQAKTQTKYQPSRYTHEFSPTQINVAEKMICNQLIKALKGDVFPSLEGSINTKLNDCTKKDDAGMGAENMGYAFREAKAKFQHNLASAKKSAPKAVKLLTRVKDALQRERSPSKIDPQERETVANLQQKLRDKGVATPKPDAPDSGSQPNGPRSSHGG